MIPIFRRFLHKQVAIRDIKFVDSSVFRSGMNVVRMDFIVRPGIVVLNAVKINTAIVVRVVVGLV